MAGCILPDFTIRLIWIKTLVKQGIFDGRSSYCHRDNQSLERSFRSIRLLHGNVNFRERRRAAPAPAEKAHKHLRDGSALKKAVTSLVYLVYQGTAIDSYDCVKILQMCSKHKDLESVQQVHDCIKKSGLEQNSFVANSLLKCYIGCGRLQDAQELFNRVMNKDTVSWTIMIGGYVEHDQAEDAIEVYKQWRNEGGLPDAVTYLTVLKACANPIALKWGKYIHAHIVQDGFQRDVRVGTALVHMYSNCGSIGDARAVFDKIEGRNLFSWTAMIGALAQYGQGEEAFSHFHRMLVEGVEPTAATYVSILNSNASEGALAWVKKVHSHAIRSGWNADLRVESALVHMYAKCGSIDDAIAVFDKMEVRDVVSWNAMIGGLAQHGLGHEAFSLLLQMQKEGFRPNSITYTSILNPCSNACGLEWVKEVHAHAMRAGLDVDLRVGSALVHMYAKSGSIEDAKTAFDKLGKRNIVSWNVMIGGLAQHGYGQEAFSLFQQMQEEGFAPDAATYMNILNPNSCGGALAWVKVVHSHAERSGLHGDLRVANALVHMYAKSGSIGDAREVYERMQNRDVISWTSMIGGLAEHGLGNEAFSLFLQMLREGFIPDQLTYVSILNPSSSTGALNWVKEVHSYAVRAGLDVDLRVGNSLVQMYVKSGSIEDARIVFNRMEERDVISWTTIIGGLAEHGLGHEAFCMFLRMQEEGFEPDAFTYVSILNPCLSTGASEWVEEVHAHAAEAGLDVDLHVGSALVHMYAKSGITEKAKAVFDRMERRNVVIWNAMIGGLAQCGHGQEAFALFDQMQREGFVPNAATYMSILNSNASEGALAWVREIHRHAVRSGLNADVRVGNALVHMYAKSGSVEDARIAFDGMEERDVISWTSVIGGLAQNGFGHDAFSRFLQMEREGFIPDSSTYVSILNPCSSGGALLWVKEVHAHAVKAGLDVDLRVGNALVHMYAKSGSIEDARAVFDKMEIRDLITWNVMIGGLAQHGLGHEAFSLFLQMQREGFVPSSFTYVNILNPCSTTIEWAKEVHARAQDAGLDIDLRVGNALVNTYAKIGSIADARLVFDNMPNRDEVSWTAMIGGLAHHGHGRDALQLFEEMKSTCLKINGPSFVAVLSACSHAGLVDDGRFHFVSMTRDYGIQPALEHYTCMVDILGRAGHLEEAKHFIFNMSIKPNVATWGALLGACRLYKNIKLAEHAAEQCLNLEPMNPSPYVLLSNVYAAAGKWDQVSLIRGTMKERGIRKNPGLCWIAVDNEVHHFIAGDSSHPEAREIYAVLNSLYEKMNAEGYNPDTRLVLRNIHEDDKENALCSHSERLAIAYGLMHVSPSKSIRIYKNLRICKDCHTATKLISNITGREILARDANRFHLFKDGVCSCGDYW